ncbi:disease resistance protein RML1A [Capsella rubella]|nr:disease resistance protein RML1A [Capsella rubella]
MRTFNDQGIERSHTIGPEVVQGIRESKVSIVVLSPNYASSRWCLDELVEIIKCKETSEEMIVMPIFNRVSPSNVRIQNGAFGKAFDKTCEGETKEVKKRWSNALTHVGSLRGDYALLWDDDAKMLEDIATHVSLILKDKC